MAKFTKEPLSTKAMSTVERYASQQGSTLQQRAAQALEELDARKAKQAQALDQGFRREAKNQIKEYDFQSRLSSNNYDVERQGEFKNMRTKEDYMNSYGSRMNNIQRIADTEYMEEAPYDTSYQRPHFNMMSSNPAGDLANILKESMVGKIRADVAKRHARASSERRVLNERSAEHISGLFDDEDGGLAGLSPSMLSTRSIQRGGYEGETASAFGMLNQTQAMRRAAQVEQMRENHREAIEKLKRDRSEGGIHRLDTDDATRREWEDMEAQRGYSIQQRYGQGPSLGDIGDIRF